MVDEPLYIRLIIAPMGRAALRMTREVYEIQESPDSHIFSATHTVTSGLYFGDSENDPPSVTTKVLSRDELLTLINALKNTAIPDDEKSPNLARDGVSYHLITDSFSASWRPGESRSEGLTDIIELVVQLFKED